MKFGIISGMGISAELYFVNKLIDKIYAPKDQEVKFKNNLNSY